MLTKNVYGQTNPFYIVKPQVFSANTKTKSLYNYCRLQARRQEFWCGDPDLNGDRLKLKFQGMGRVGEGGGVC